MTVDAGDGESLKSAPPVVVDVPPKNFQKPSDSSSAAEVRNRSVDVSSSLHWPGDADGFQRKSPTACREWIDLTNLRMKNLAADSRIVTRVVDLPVGWLVGW